MRRGLSLLLATALSALAWVSPAGEFPASPSARWRAPVPARGANASQPREVRARVALAVATQNLLWPRASASRGAQVVSRAGRSASAPLRGRPAGTPQTPLVLRI